MTVSAVLGKIAMKAVLGAVGGAFMVVGASVVENALEAKKAAKVAAKAAKMAKEAKEAYDYDMTEEAVNITEEVVQDFSEAMEDGA